MWAGNPRPLSHFICDSCCRYSGSNSFKPILKLFDLPLSQGIILKLAVGADITSYNYCYTVCFNLTYAEYTHSDFQLWRRQNYLIHYRSATQLYETKWKSRKGFPNHDGLSQLSIRDNPYDLWTLPTKGMTEYLTHRGTKDTKCR